MAVSAINDRPTFERAVTLDNTPDSELIEAQASTYDLLILAFAGATRAEMAAHLLRQLAPLERSGDTGALILTKDVLGASHSSRADGIMHRLRSLPARVRRVMLRILPGPLSVLTGGSASAHTLARDSTDPLASSDDFDWLARCITVDSSVVLLLVEHQVMAEVAERVAEDALLARAGSLQITLDEGLERFTPHQ